MSKVQIPLNSVLDGSILKKCPEIVQAFHNINEFMKFTEILSGNYGILNVIVDLRECLTHSEPIYRGGGINFLAAMLRLLPKTFLKSEELRELSTYICERLKDQKSVIPSALGAVSTIILMENFPKCCLTDLLKIMFDNIPCQQQALKDRLIYISIIRECLIKDPEGMSALNNQLFTAFLESIDGERDPKCLVLNYNTFIELSKILPGIETTEDMFEVFAVYFPIDFSVPIDPNRPYTRDKLARLLKMCLLAYRDFSKYLLPLVLEKLDSHFEVAKIDSLEILLESCNTYKDEDFKPFLVEICKLLRLEILTGPDSTTCGLSLRVLKRLSETLTESKFDLVEIVLNFCVPFLVEPSMQHQYSTIINVLYMTGVSCDTACTIILQKILPILLQAPLSINSIAAVNILLTSHKITNAKLSDELMLEIINYLSQQIADAKISSLAIATLSLISINTSYKSRCLVYSNSLRILSSDTALAEHLICHLLNMAAVNSEEFRTDFVPLLIQNMSTNVASQRCMEILMRLAFMDNETEFYFEKILHMIRNPDLFTTCLGAFLYVLKFNKENRQLNTETISILTDKYNILEEIESTLMNISLIADCTTLNIVSQLYAHLVPNLPTAILAKQINVDRCKSWSNKSLAIYTGLICNLSKTWTISYLDELCFCLIDSALNFSEPERVNANITLYRIINRESGNKNMHGILNEVRDKLRPLFKNENKRYNALESWSWIIKALVISGNKIYIEWLQEIFSAAPLFGDLLRPVFRILCFDCPVFDGVEGILYKQRLFNLTQSLINITPNSTTNLFIYNLLISCMPQSVLNMDAEKISSVLAESIRTDDPELLWISLSNINKILQTSTGSVSVLLYENVERFLPKLLDIAKHGKHQVQRRVALISINLYANSKRFLTRFVKYKQEVQVSLKKCLNDPSRNIRIVVHDSLENWSNIDNSE